MTKIEESAIRTFPVDETHANTPLLNKNISLREAYILGAEEFCRTIWAKVKVDETKLAGRDLDEQIPLCVLSDKLNEISEFCYDLYHEPPEFND